MNRLLANAPSCPKRSDDAQRLPGLGNETGLIDLDSEAMQQAAEQDPEIADFVRRARDFWPSYIAAAQAAGPDYYARGCGWVE